MAGCTESGWREGCGGVVFDRRELLCVVGWFAAGGGGWDGREWECVCVCVWGGGGGIVGGVELRLECEQ